MIIDDDEEENNMNDVNPGSTDKKKVDENGISRSRCTFRMRFP
jgi:hypothetical protein